MMSSFIVVIQMIFRIIAFVIIVDALLSFVLPPFNPVRSFLDKIVEPMLNPIRRIIPNIGGFDLSPIALLLLLQLIEYLIISLIR